MPCDDSIMREGVTEYYEDDSECWFEECDFYDYDEDDNEYCANYYWYRDPTCEPDLFEYEIEGSGCITDEDEINAYW